MTREGCRCSSTVEALTAARGSESFAPTAQFYVNQATIPLAVALFSCDCGATQVLHGFEPPSGWVTGADGSDRCARCAASQRLDDHRAARPEEPDDSAPR